MSINEDTASDPNLAAWLNQLAVEMNGWYDEEDDALLVDGEMGASSYRYTEIMQMYRSRHSPREAADILRQGGMP